jgi:hypothetical protein
MSRRSISLVIIVLLVAGALAWRFHDTTEVYSKEDKARVQLAAIAQALQDYAVKNGAFPGPEAGLSVLISSDEFSSEGLKDPWNQIISYECLNPACDTVKLASAGPPGFGKDRASDLTLVVKRSSK